MYQISFNELALNGIISKPWDIVYLDGSNKVQSKSNEDNDTYQQRWNSVIPSKGVISISAKSEKQLLYELCFTIIYDIPCVQFSRQLTMNNKFTGKKLSKNSINKMTTGMSVDDAQIWLTERIDEKEIIETEKPTNMNKYDSLPDIKWIQLNPSDNLFIIHVKLQKVNTVLSYSISRNEYWIYKVVKIVFRCRKIYIISPVNVYPKPIQQILMKHKRNICNKQIAKTNKIIIKMIRKPIHISLI